MKPIDITLGLSSSVASWPGDRPFNFRWTARMEDGTSVNLSEICMSPHVGTHIDAPLHFLADGMSVDQIPLEPLMGDCFVLDLGASPGSSSCIDVTELAASKTEFSEDSPNRLLLNTHYQRHNPFNPQFRRPSLEAVHWLSEQGTLLLGTDAPSVDDYHSTTMDVHRYCHRHHLTILENLDLTAVSQGWYQLLALPLRVIGGEAAPARVILIPHKNTEGS